LKPHGLFPSFLNDAKLVRPTNGNKTLWAHSFAAVKSQLASIGAIVQLMTVRKNVPTKALAISTKMQPSRALLLLSFISFSRA
jgi:hypothetical protein